MIGHRRAGARWQAVRRNLVGLIFAAPWLAGFLWLTVYPMLSSAYYSLTRYNLMTPPKWVGLSNYRSMLSDGLFWKALGNTAIIAGLGLALGTVAALGVALLLNQRIGGLSVYRTVFYLPSVVPVVASSMIWMWLLNPQYGLINSFLARFGITGPGWVASPVWSKPAIVLTTIWGIGTSVVIYLAGLQDIPRQLYEAASLDGATAWARTRYITLPMLSPVIFFNVVVGLIDLFQVFTQPYIMTQGGPADSSLTYVMYLYRYAFRFLQMGYASALAWVLFLLVLLLTLGLFRASRGRVYYAGEGR